MFHILTENVFILGSALPEPSRHHPPGMIIISTPQGNLFYTKSSVDNMVLKRSVCFCLSERDPKPRRMRRRTGHLLGKKEDFHEESSGPRIRHIFEVAIVAFLNLSFLMMCVPEGQ